MTKQQGGARKRTRHLLRKKPRDRGKVTITRLLQDFKPGENVSLQFEPTVQKGMPHSRYYGKIGKVIKKQGSAYLVEIKDRGKVKRLLAAPVHLKKLASISASALPSKVRARGKG